MGSGSRRSFPRSFGSYLLLGSLGRGGMGEVFLARRGQVRGAEHLCVLKTMRTDVGADGEYAERFLDEARLAVNLTHANICHVFDVGRVDDELFLAMEHIAGVTLRQLLDASTAQVPPSQALHIGCELLDALDYAHRRVHPVTQEVLNIVHRDVSPQNLMVTFEGELKLIDFGLAVSRLKKEETSAEVVMGKLSYMSPEQMQGRPVDARTDQFAAAIMIYELLAGERYYGGTDRSVVVAQALSGSYRPPRWSTLDEATQAALSRALSFRREDRYATCEAFARDLRAIPIGKSSRADIRDLVRTVLPKAASTHAARVSQLARASAGMESNPTVQALEPVRLGSTEDDQDDDGTEVISTFDHASTAMESQPTVIVDGPMPAPATSGRGPIFAAVAGVVLVAVVVVVAVRNAQPPPSIAAPVVVAPPPPVVIAPVAVAAVVVVDAGVVAPAVVDAGVVEPVVAHDHARPRHPKVVAEKAPEKPAEVHVMPPVATMWAEIERCAARKVVCAQGLVNTTTQDTVQKGALERCYRKCLGIPD